MITQCFIFLKSLKICESGNLNHNYENKGVFVF